jgi:hypothetical protein
MAAILNPISPSLRWLGARQNSPINNYERKTTMADYFTNFSLVLNLANETEQAYALDLARKASLAQQGEPVPDDFPKSLVDMVEDWQFETVADDSGTKHAIWLHSMYGGVMQCASSFNICSRNSIQRVM